MIYIKKDLIKKELKQDGLEYHPFNLHNSLISKLSNHYECVEICENYYDGEPEFDDEEFNMYLDYKDNFKLTGLSLWSVISNLEEIKSDKYFKYSKNLHTEEELKKAYHKICKMYKDYEPSRIEFCNWCEPYFEGNWGYSQEFVDIMAKKILKEIRKSNISNKNRLYIAYDNDMIRIYWYGRDFKERDYWFIFKRKMY